MQRGIVGAAALILCLLLNPLIAADPVEIHVEASADEIFIGESVDYQVDIRNAKNPKAPDLSDLRQDFEIASMGDHSRNQSSTFILNGRVSQQNIFSHVYLYRLTPKKTGELTIPSAKLTLDGKTLTSNALPLRVVDAEKQDLVLVEIKTDQQRLYPTQPFSVTLRVLIRPLPNSDDVDPLSPLRRRPPHLQINWAEPPAGLSGSDNQQWLQPLVSETGVGFSLNEFASRAPSLFDDRRVPVIFSLPRSRENRDDLEGKSVNYFVYELTRKLTAEKSGTYQLGPAIVKGTFVAGVDGNEYLAKKLVAIAPAKTIEVREVPTPRPATFCGGIGSYTLAASASPTRLRVGDPLTLTVELARGEQSGSLDLISAPDLDAIPDVAANFDLIDKNPTGRIEGTIKKFSYALRPKKPGVSIPALAVTTFDPSTEKFTDIKSEAIPLEVTEASRISGGDLVGSLPAGSNSEIRTKAEGIFQNITNPGEFRDERVNLGTWFGLVLGCWCITGTVILAFTAYRLKSSDTVWQRRQQARRQANRRVGLARESLEQGRTLDALHHIRSAIVGLIADLRNRVTEGLTAADVSSALMAASVPPEDRAATQQLLESIEAAEYGAGTSTDAAPMIESATKLIGRIALYLERGV